VTHAKSEKPILYVFSGIPPEDPWLVLPHSSHRKRVTYWRQLFQCSREAGVVQPLCRAFRNTRITTSRFQSLGLWLTAGSMGVPVEDLIAFVGGFWACAGLRRCRSRVGLLSAYPMLAHA
jgi:hypothetical protein